MAFPSVDYVPSPYSASQAPTYPQFPMLIMEQGSLSAVAGPDSTFN